jgi:hypothetical protein
MNQKPGKFLGTASNPRGKRKEKKIYYSDFLGGGGWDGGRYVSAYKFFMQILKIHQKSFIVVGEYAKWGGGEG